MSSGHRFILCEQGVGTLLMDSKRLNTARSFNEGESVSNLRVLRRFTSFVADYYNSANSHNSSDILGPEYIY